MTNDFQIANLSSEQYAKINELENSLGVILIAWDNSQGSEDEEYYQKYEHDRI